MSELKTYSHVYTLCYTVESNNPKGHDVFGVHHVNGVLKRMIDLNENAEWQEACGPPQDTFEVQE